MSTFTVDVVDALRPQPEMVIVLVTAEPASGIETSVPLVPVQPGGGGGGGGVVPVPVKSSRFGEPLPGLPTTPVVAALVSALVTCAAVNDGFAARTSAAAPATCGAAIDVPLIVFVAVLLVCQAEVMLTPGAKMSTHEP